MDILELFVHEKKPDIISVVEHWCCSENVETMTIPGYFQAAYYCRPNREHGGSMIYVKAGHQVKSLCVSQFSEELECEICGIIVIAHNIRIGIVSVYRPGSGNVENFLERISLSLNHCYRSADLLFLCGDLNIDFLKVGCKSRILLLDLMECFNLKRSSNEPTRVFSDITGHVSISKLDYILTNAELENCNVEVYDAFISDHRIVSLELPMNFNIKTQNVHKIIRNLSQHNIDNFVYSISQCQFCDIYYFQHVDECFDAFFNIIRDTFDDCCPFIRCTGRVENDKRWITPDIIAAKHNLNNLHWLHKNLNSQITYDLYRKTKSSYHSLIKRTKFEYNKKLIDLSENKNKTVWDMVNSTTGRKKMNHKSIFLMIDDVSYEDPKEVAEIFVDYFTTIAATSLNIYYKGPSHSSCTTSSMFDKNFFFYPVLDHEVVDAVKMLKKNKSSGTDFVSARILKLIVDDICTHFAHIINLSVSTGVFPHLLKKATIVPVFKKDNVSDVSNYRPVAILSTFSKVFEKIVYGRMMKYLDKFQILDNAQHGFRSGRSTQTGALSLVEFLYEHLDNGMHVASLFFDLSRAFDSLSHKFILEKLYNLGFRGIFHDWVGSYLESRVASVRINNSYSSERNLKLGVPQGSVLGPLLFLIFINDLPSSLRNIFIDLSNCDQTRLKNIRILLFADDSTIAVTATTLEELQRLCETLVQSFVEWCRMNKIMMNIGKTECVHFSCQNVERDSLVVQYLDTVITSKDHAKFLGIHIDRCLKWHTHIDGVCKKLSNSYYALSRVKSILPVKSLINIYYSLVYSHLSYNILLWGNATDVNRAFILQKRIIRLIFNSHPRSSCRPLFRENYILTLASLFILKCLMYVKENENIVTKLSSFHSHNTRNKEKLYFPIHKTAKFEMSPHYQSIKLFNHLPRCIQGLKINEFRRRVKELLIKECFYSVKDYYCYNFENCSMFL